MHLGKSYAPIISWRWGSPWDPGPSPPISPWNGGRSTDQLCELYWSPSAAAYYCGQLLQSPHGSFSAAVWLGIRIQLAVTLGEAARVGTSHPWEEPDADSVVSRTAVPWEARYGCVFLTDNPVCLCMSLSSYVLDQKTAERSITYLEVTPCRWKHLALCSLNVHYRD